LDKYVHDLELRGLRHQNPKIKSKVIKKWKQTMTVFFMQNRQNRYKVENSTNKKSTNQNFMQNGFDKSVESWMDTLAKGEILKEVEIKQLCAKYIEILQSQPNTKRLSSPITVYSMSLSP
jgi:hypothetical protein